MDRAAAIELVRGLVAIPSISRHEAPASAWLVDQMRKSGYDRAFVDDAGNAVGELGDPSAPRTIVLLGHIDTVPGDIPVRIEASADGDVLFGRGSVDAKGPLATFVAGAARFGARAARDANLRIVVVGAVVSLTVSQFVLRHGGTDVQWFWFRSEPQGLVQLRAQAKALAAQQGQEPS